jgi:hypothetical protein
MFTITQAQRNFQQIKQREKVFAIKVAEIKKNNPNITDKMARIIAKRNLELNS